MNRTSRQIAITALLALITTQAAVPQSSPKRSPGTDSDSRRDELAKVNEALADRDPLMRLANLEAIINSGDALRIEVALRLAFLSDDSELRALATRGYIASRKEILLDIQLPAALQRQYDEALTDPDKTTAFFNTHPYVRVLSLGGFRVHYVFSKFSVSDSTGVIADSTRGSSATASTFSISGDRLAASVETQGLGLCRVDFRPTGNLFKGSLSCNFSYGGGPAPKLDVSAPEF